MNKEHNQKKTSEVIHFVGICKKEQLYLQLLNPQKPSVKWWKSKKHNMTSTDNPNLFSNYKIPAITEENTVILRYSGFVQSSASFALLHTLGK